MLKNIIIRDFNLDLLKCDSHFDTDSFLNIMLSNRFQPHIVQPTRITDHSSTFIDNIFFYSIDEFFTVSVNLIYDLSDHLPNFVIINNYHNLPNKIKLFKRDYSNFDENLFVEESLESDPSKMFDSLYSNLSKIIDNHIPIKQLSRKELKVKSKPWVTSAIKTSIQIKNKLYKKFLKTKAPYYQTKFKLYRNKINHLLKVSIKGYIITITSPIAKRIPNLYGKA